ncbi:MAG: hypothetical protein RR603_06350, partial [Kurthia sp.]
MTKFKVGDKVVFNEANKENAKEFGYKPNEAYEVKYVFPNMGTVRITNENGIENTFDDARFELAESKQTKNQRITTLENEVAELKLIVAQIRKPSTIVSEALVTESVEDNQAETIEFEGAQYKKVDREAEIGDVVIFLKTDVPWITNREPYKVIIGSEAQQTFIDDDGSRINVYREAIGYERTLETVDVYELIEEDKPNNPFLGFANPPIEKSPNQQRAEIIEKAKVFVEKHTTPNSIVDEWKAKGAIRWDGRGVIPKFRINEEKRVVVLELIG